MLSCNRETIFQLDTSCCQWKSLVTAMSYLFLNYLPVCWHRTSNIKNNDHWSCLLSKLDDKILFLKTQQIWVMYMEKSRGELPWSTIPTGIAFTELEDSIYTISLQATKITDLGIYAFWYNNATNTMEISNYFLIGSMACSMRWNHMRPRTCSNIGPKASERIYYNYFANWT